MRTVTVGGERMAHILDQSRKSSMATLSTLDLLHKMFHIFTLKRTEKVTWSPIYRCIWQLQAQRERIKNSFGTAEFLHFTKQFEEMRSYKFLNTVP